MLVKFKNDTEEFEQKIDDLKEHFDVVVASKAAEKCLDNYLDLYDRFHNSEKKVKRLLDVIDGLRDAVHQRQAADEQIQILLGEKL